MSTSTNNILISFVLAVSLLLSIGCSTTEEPIPTPIPEPTPEPQAPREWEDATLVWSDEFDGESLDTDKWEFETGAGGWGNQEWQNYTDGENIEISDGTLKIIAKKVGGGQRSGDYTSTRLNSTDDWTHGRMEIRAKMPEDKGSGLWPAIWMLGENIATVGWPKCGEIDIMEYVSFEPNKVHHTIHSEANNHSKGTQIGSGAKNLLTIEEEFHNYGILWDGQSIKFYVDDIDNIQLNFQKPSSPNDNNWPFNKGFYFLLNIAVGGTWGGLEGVDDSIFPATMEIDYVRVYQFM